MEVRRALRLYLKSPLNLALAGAAGGLLLLTLLFAPAALPLAAPLVAIAYAGLTAALFLSRRGAQAVAAEAEEERRRRILERIGRFRELRERIAYLRIGEEEMRKAVEHFLLVSGEYLDRAAELAVYSPPCNQAIEEVLEIVQIYLKELDESATERRYAVRDPRDFADYQERTLAAVRERARLIKEKAVEFFDELTPEERMRVLEEMEDL
jgi:hypothetical protein